MGLVYMRIAGYAASGMGEACKSLCEILVSSRDFVKQTNNEVGGNYPCLTLTFFMAPGRLRIKVSRLRLDKKGKRVADEDDEASQQGSTSGKSDPKGTTISPLACLDHWRNKLPEETRKLYANKLFDLTTIGVADDDVYKAALAVEDEVYMDATSLSDYKTRMAAKYDAVIPTSVCGQTKTNETAQRIFLTAQTFFDDDNFRSSLDPTEPMDTSKARESILKEEKRNRVTQANFSSVFGNPCGLVPGHRRLAKATHSALEDFFGGRLEPGAEAFKAHFKASDATRKNAIGSGLNVEGHVQPNQELADVDEAIEAYYSA